MSERLVAPAGIERFPSGLAGLDTILEGGFLKGGVYIVIGAPGCGKTIFANQIAFHHVRDGGRVVYVSLLAESHARLFAHMAGLTFFDQSHVAESIHYVSGYQALEGDGLQGLLTLIRREMRDREGTMLVLDGLVAAEAFAPSNLHMKKFVHELQTLVALIGCTAFLLTSGSDLSKVHAEHTMVDGLVELTNPLVGVRQVRELFVRKFRGSNHLQGRHTFEITNRGIVVYPRLESRTCAEPPMPGQAKRLVTTGIDGLDAALGGGLGAGTSTLLLGPSGSGKTVAALHFLAAGAAQGERVLYYGFNESPPRLLDRASRAALDLRQAASRGLLKVMWRPSVDHNADGIAEEILAACRAHRATRLVIDTVTGLKDAVLYPERTHRFLAALTNELRILGVSTLLIEETPQLFSPGIEVPESGVSAIVEALVFVRQVELGSRLRRLLCVLKTRESAHDPTLREFVISDDGVQVLGPLDAEDIMTGVVHQNAEPGERTKRARPRAGSRSSGGARARSAKAGSRGKKPGGKRR